jgi:glycosyltransferase involved in cell wall biosynthesis
VRRSVDDGLEISLRVHGPALTEPERRHRAALERLTAELDLGRHVELRGPVPRSDVPGLLAEADVLVNNMRAGAPDKVVYEACASCVPVLASNPMFEPLLPASLRFEREDPAALAARLRDFAALPAAERTRLGRALRERVEREHAVETWADAVVRLAGLR